MDHRLESIWPTPRHGVIAPGIALAPDLVWFGRRMFLVHGDGPITLSTPATNGLVADVNPWVSPPGSAPQSVKLAAVTSAPIPPSELSQARFVPGPNRAGSSVSKTPSAVGLEKLMTSLMSPLSCLP